MMVRCNLLQGLALAAMVAMAGASFAADWPQWRGPERNAISKETGLLKQWPAEGPKKVWEVSLGAGASSFAVVGDRVYTMYQDAANEYGVALDAATGKTVWQYTMGAPYKNVASGPRSTPTVDGDLVYFIDAQGNLACLKAADGKEVWKVNFVELAGAKYAPWHVACSPFISGDLLVVNAGGNPRKPNNSSIMAFNKKTGQVIWKSGNDVAGYSTPVEMKVGGVEMFALLTGENVVGVAAKDGNLLWSYPWPNRSKINVPQVIVDGDKVFATTGYNIGCVLLQVVPANGGFEAKEVWPINKSMECRYGNPVLLDGYVYGFDDKQLTCVELKSGKQMWTQDGFGYGALSYAEGLFYIMGEKGNLALAKLTPEKCQIVSEVKILPEREALWAMPTVANGKLYIRNSQKIICLDIQAK